MICSYGAIIHLSLDMVSYALDHKIFNLGNVPTMKSDSPFEQMSMCGKVSIMKSDFLFEQMSPIPVHDDHLTLKLKYTHR